MSTDTAGSPAMTLYESLGGSGPLKIAVDRFYVAVTEDPQLVHSFEGRDLARLKRHQVLLLSQVLGGPGGVRRTPARGRAPRTAHHEHRLRPGRGAPRGHAARPGSRRQRHQAVEGVVANVRRDLVDRARSAG
jgi:hemoglobin